MFHFLRNDILRKGKDRNQNTSSNCSSKLLQIKVHLLLHTSGDFLAKRTDCTHFRPVKVELVFHSFQIGSDRSVLEATQSRCASLQHRSECKRHLAAACPRVHWLNRGIRTDGSVNYRCKQKSVLFPC